MVDPIVRARGKVRVQHHPFRVIMDRYPALVDRHSCGDIPLTSSHPAVVEKSFRPSRKNITRCVPCLHKFVGGEK